MKMLLVGELNEALYSLNEYLSENFEIQMCSENSKNVKDMIRLLRPSIIVFNILDMKEDISEIFEMMSGKLDGMPTVVIGTSQLLEELKPQTDVFKNIKTLERPLKASEVQRACFEVLKLDTPKEVSNTEISIKSEKKKILVVDDSALILRRIKQLLEPDYIISLANSGEKAIDLLDRSAIDLILLDYDMPGMNGCEVFEKMLERDKTKNIPVVFLTSVAEKEQILKVLKNKPFGYILKPPANDKIRSVIGEALK